MLHVSLVNKFTSGSHEHILVGIISVGLIQTSLPKGCHLEVVGGPSILRDPESDAGRCLSSW
jgi:hypothetical protein